MVDHVDPSAGPTFRCKTLLLTNRGPSRWTGPDGRSRQRKKGRSFRLRSSPRFITVHSLFYSSFVLFAGFAVHPPFQIIFGTVYDTDSRPPTTPPPSLSI